MINPRLLAFAILLSLAGKYAYAQFDTVSTQYGFVSGLRDGDVYIFKGIPYAAPPVGDLRWKAPQPAINWEGVRECKEFSASPYQPIPVPFLCWTEEFIAPPKPISEDCLYLNIWSAAKSNKEKRPVFVWIYGGGFISGSAACTIYDGEEMAKRGGIVFVSFNYRVGPFGFMAHPELTKEQGKASGNYGILDQIAALKWVQKNIAAFGGDPNQVTIAGQSAGSWSVNVLMLSPLAKGLFHQAIAQSGGILPDRAQTTLSEAEKMGLAFQEKAGAKNITELRQLSPEEILKLDQSFGIMKMGLTLDDYVLPIDYYSEFKRGNFNNISLMTGWLTGDGAFAGPLTATAEKAQQEARVKYGNKASLFLQAFPANTDQQAKESQALLNIMQFAALPAYQLANFNRGPAYLYQIGYVPTDKEGFPNYGAFHTSEVPFALHTLHLWKRNWQMQDYQMQDLLSSYWLNFIRTGNPNGKGLPEWKRFENTNPSILDVKNEAISRPALLRNQFDALQMILSK